MCEMRNRFCVMTTEIYEIEIVKYEMRNEVYEVTIKVCEMRIEPCGIRNVGWEMRMRNENRNV